MIDSNNTQNNMKNHFTVQFGINKRCTVSIIKNTNHQFDSVSEIETHPTTLNPWLHHHLRQTVPKTNLFFPKKKDAMRCYPEPRLLLEDGSDGVCSSHQFLSEAFRICGEIPWKNCWNFIMKRLKIEE